MKVTFEFDTDSENFNCCEYEQIKKAPNLANVVWDWDSYLRSLYKHSDKTEFNIEELRDKWYDLLSENDVSIDKLWS